MTTDDARARLREHRLDDEQEAALRRLMGERVKFARQDLGLSRQELAAEFGKTGGWVREIELGKSWPPHPLLSCLGGALGLSASIFYSTTSEVEEIQAEIDKTRKKFATEIRRGKPMAVKNAAALLGVSLSHTWKLIADGKLTSKKEGRNTVVTAASVADYYMSPEFVALDRARARREE